MAESEDPVRAVSRRPGERAGLNADTVLAEGRRLLEEEGAEALTMRRLAARLGVAPNSLYSHIPDKAALLDAVLDSLLAEIELPELDQGDWRDGLVDLMAASRTMLLEHGDLLPQLLSRPMRGPHARRLGEQTLGLLERGGITGPAAVDALRALLTLTFGSVVLDAPRRHDPDPTSRQSRTYAAFATPTDTPRMARLADPLSRPPTEGAFETSLRWLIDGISRSVR